LELAQANAERNGVQMNLYASNLFGQVEGAFDVIAFNPPMRPDETEYSRIVTSLLRRSPHISRLLMALWGDRLESSRSAFLISVIAEARQHLNPGGRLLLAINANEVAELAALPGVRLARELPLPGMAEQEVAEFRFEAAS
jgi:16S rRNA G1207 methylase RsmC